MKYMSVEKLSHGTYVVGRPTSHMPSVAALGAAHEETALRLVNSASVKDEELPIYDFFLGRVYEKALGRPNAAEWVKSYIKKYRNVADSIRSNGFDVAFYPPSGQRGNLLGGRGLPEVDLLPDGTPILVDGNRRIAILKALGIERVPVELNRAAANVKRIIGAKLNKMKSGILIQSGRRITYQPINGHEHMTTDVHRRKFETMRDQIDGWLGGVEGKRLLDVGSCFGYFCFEWARSGACSMGIEMDTNRVALCFYLARSYGLDWSNPKFSAADVADFLDAGPKRFDAISVLSTFQHIIMQGEKRAWRTLERMADMSDVVFLSMPHRFRCAPTSTHRKAGGKEHDLGSQSEVPRLIADKTSLAHSEALCEFNGRTLFALTR